MAPLPKDDKESPKAPLLGSNNRSSTPAPVLPRRIPSNLSHASDGSKGSNRSNNSNRSNRIIIRKPHSPPTTTKLNDNKKNKRHHRRAHTLDSYDVMVKSAVQEFVKQNQTSPDKLRKLDKRSLSSSSSSSSFGDDNNNNKDQGEKTATAAAGAMSTTASPNNNVVTFIPPKRTSSYELGHIVSFSNRHLHPHGDKQVVFVNASRDDDDDNNNNNTRNAGGNNKGGLYKDHAGNDMEQPSNAPAFSSSSSRQRSGRASKKESNNNNNNNNEASEQHQEEEGLDLVEIPTELTLHSSSQDSPNGHGRIRSWWAQKRNKQQWSVRMLLLLVVLVLAIVLVVAIVVPVTRNSDTAKSGQGDQDVTHVVAPTMSPGTAAPTLPLINDSCQRALGPLTIDGYPVEGVLDASLTIPTGLTSACLPESHLLVDDEGLGPGLWYQVMGGDEVLRASTCFDESMADTRIAVYRGSCGLDNNTHDRLQCVAGNDQFCGDQSSTSWYARKGVMYYIYVHTPTPSDRAFFRFRVEYEENGLCPDAIGPIDNDGTLVVGSLRGANFDQAITCSFEFVRFGQVWYRVRGNGGWMAASTCHAMTDFEARVDVIGEECGSGDCPGVRDSDCGNGYQTIWKSELGKYYYIIVYKSTNLPGTLFGLSVKPFQPVENDICEGAIPLKLSDDISVMGSTVTATHDEVTRYGFDPEWDACKFPDHPQPGVWYSVIGTGTSLLASTCKEGTNFATKISVFRNGCDQLECVTTIDQFCNEKASVYWESNLGEDYLVLVHGSDYGVSANIGEFELTVSEFVAEQNDLCTRAVSLEIGDRVVGSTFFATHDNVPSCDNLQNDAPGVWYTVMGTGAVLRAATCDPDTDFDTKISIFQGSCGNFTCVISDDNSCGIQSSAKWATREGISYYIYVHGRQESSVGDFALLLEEFAPTTSNDFCDGAFTVPITNMTITRGSTKTATFDNAGFCGVPNAAPGIWYELVGKGTRLTASLCHEDTNYDTALSIYTGECSDLQCEGGNGDGVSRGCGRSSELTWFAKRGVIYHMLVHGFDVRTGNFGLTVTEPESAVKNDYCVHATELSVGSGQIEGTTVGATEEIVPACTGVDQIAGGVWYTVVGDGERLVASTCNEKTELDTRISVYEGVCGDFTCIRADDNACGAQSRVDWISEFGKTYFILVHGNTEGSFALTVDQFISQQPNDSCANAIGPIFADDQIISGSTIGSSFDNQEYCGVSNTGPGVWYFVFGTGERLKADTCDPSTNFDTKLSVFTGLDCDSLKCVDGNDDGCGLQSSVTWDTELGILYWVLVHGFGTNKEGNFGLTVSGSDIFRL